MRKKNKVVDVRLAKIKMNKKKLFRICHEEKFKGRFLRFHEPTLRLRFYRIFCMFSWLLFIDLKESKIAVETSYRN